MTETVIPAWLDTRAFPFRPHLVDVGTGERLSVTDIGTGPSLVFSHGTPTWSYEWRHLLAALSPDYRCVAPDHLGFGLSPRPTGSDYRPEAHAARFARLVDALGLERYSLVLHDYGGPFALAAALEHPERIERIVVFNSFAWSYGDSPQTRRMAKLAGGKLFRFLYRNVNLSFVISKSAWGDRKTMTRETWPPYLRVFPDKDSRERVLFALAQGLAGAADFCDSIWRRLDLLAGKPIHLIWGMADSAFPPSALARFREKWPQASVHELPGAGHWPHEEQPEVCVDSVRRFLELTRAS